MFNILQFLEKYISIHFFHFYFSAKYFLLNTIYPVFDIENFQRLFIEALVFILSEKTGNCLCIF